MRSAAPLLAAALAVAGCGEDIDRYESDPSGGSTGASGGGEYSLCVDLITQSRASSGRPARARWADAVAGADGEAESDSETGTAHGAFGTCGEFAQDECPGWSGDHATVITGCLELMWAEGPGGGHYENMASTSYTMVACGYHDAPGGVWAVQNFK